MIYAMDRLSDLYKALKRLATYYLPSESDRDDLTQEIAIHLWSKRDCIPASFRDSYLRSVVKNAAQDVLRKRKRKPISYFSLNENGSISLVSEPTQQIYLTQVPVVDEFEIREELQNALTAIEQLSAEQKSAVELAAAGYSYSEIAALQTVW